MGKAEKYHQFAKSEKRSNFLRPREAVKAPKLSRFWNEERASSTNHFPSEEGKTKNETHPQSQAVESKSWGVNDDVKKNRNSEQEEMDYTHNISKRGTI